MWQREYEHKSWIHIKATKQSINHLTTTAALLALTKVYLPGKEGTKIVFLWHVATEKRKLVNAVCNLPTNQKVECSVQGHSKQAKPSRTDT